MLLMHQPGPGHPHVSVGYCNGLSPSTLGPLQFLFTRQKISEDFFQHVSQILSLHWLKLTASHSKWSKSSSPTVLQGPPIWTTNILSLMPSDAILLFMMFQQAGLYFKAIGLAAPSAWNPCPLNLTPSLFSNLNSVSLYQLPMSAGKTPQTYF